MIFFGLRANAWLESKYEHSFHKSFKEDIRVPGLQSHKCFHFVSSFETWGKKYVKITFRYDQAFLLALIDYAFFTS